MLVALSRRSRSLLPRVARLSTSSEPSDRLEAAFADYESGKLAAAVEDFSRAPPEAAARRATFGSGCRTTG